MVTKLSKIVQMGMLTKSVAFDTVSPVGGAKRFRNVLLEHQLAAAALYNSKELAHVCLDSGV